MVSVFTALRPKSASSE